MFGLPSGTETYIIGAVLLGLGVIATAILTNLGNHIWETYIKPRLTPNQKKNQNSQPVIQSEIKISQQPPPIPEPPQPSIKLASILRIILGVLLIIGGIAVIFYGYETWTSAYQLKNATSPGFLTNLIVSAVESVGLDILGILMIIFGGFIINKDATMVVLRILNDHFNRDS